MGPAESGSTDLGRRIELRRAELGLGIDEVAAQAGMDPGYLTYLEHRPAQPSPGTLLRLASVLQTTPDELLGGHVNLPPGRGAPAAHPRLVELGVEECRQLIRPGGVGRVVVSASPAPMAFPVNYATREDAILFRTARDTVLTAHFGEPVGFEVDHVDEAMKEGWSVLVAGVMRELGLSAEAGPDVTPWAGSDRDVQARIEPDSITGRRIVTH